MPDHPRSSASIEATYLEDIKFPEFTAKLITDTFDALINANITQMEAYTELVKIVGMTLSDYINNTKDYISGEEILNFLADRIPPLQSETTQTSAVYKGKTLDEHDATELNRVFRDAEQSPDEYNSGDQMTETNWGILLDAVAGLIAQNKYMILQQMVRQGMLRLVIENGIIETRLNFRANSYRYSYERSSDYERSTERKGRGGGIGGSLFSFFGGYSRRTHSTDINVSTSRTGETTTDSTNIQITGLVRLNFKTDYLRLSE